MPTLETTKTLTPLLKWAGGKRKLAPAIAKHYEPFRDTHQWCEPFVGGMGATLGVMPAEAILNDANPHLINFYEWVKNSGKFYLTLDETVNNPLIYVNRREWFNTLVGVVSTGIAGHDVKAESAQLFYYLNRSCFNGLCRFNQSGEFNVPFGKYKTINYQTELGSYQKVFSRWQFTCGDFEKLTDQISDRPTFTYCDPPYDCEFTSYSKGGFGWDEQVRLAEWCAKLSEPVLVSNAATDRIIELYTKLGFEIETFPVSRSISCKGDSRTPALEIFATKNMNREDKDSTIDRKEMLLDPSNNVEVQCDRQVPEDGEENTHFSAYPPAIRPRPTTAGKQKVSID